MSADKFPNNKNWLFESVKFAAAFSFCATLLSITANFIIFGGWGLNFASIANTPDILFSGISAVIWITPFFLIPAVIAIYIKVFNFSKIENSYTKLNYYVSLILFAALMATASAFMLFRDSYFINVYLPMYVFYFSFAYLTISYGLLYGLDYKEATSVQVLSLLASLLIIMFGQLSDAGVANLVILSESKRCVGDEYVVWLGTESVVSSCNKRHYRNNQDFYILERAGLQFKKTGEQKDLSN